MLMLSVECGQRVFLFTPLIIATSHRVQTVDILPSQSDWCRHDALHNTRNIIHLPAWGRVLFILYNSLYFIWMITIKIWRCVGDWRSVWAEVYPRKQYQLCVIQLWGQKTSIHTRLHPLSLSLSLTLSLWRLKTKLQLDCQHGSTGLKTLLTRLLTNFKLG